MTDAARRLRAGENVPLARGRCVVCIVGGGALWALPLDTSDQLTGSARPIAPDDGVDVAELPAPVIKVLLVSVGAIAPTVVTITDAAGAAMVFDARPEHLGDVALLAEFYRRPDGSWKYRALGQSVPDVAALQRIHGVMLPGPSASGSTPSAAGADATAAGTAASISAAPTPQQQWPRIAAGIWEDASRSALTYADAERYAGMNRDTALQELMGDPTARTADDPRRRTIERRHQGIIDRAAERRFGELDHLVREVAEVESDLPAPLARWSSARWHQLADDEIRMIRSGEVSRADSSSLRIPMFRDRAVQGGYLLFPWTPDQEAGARSLVRRLLAAGPIGRSLQIITDDIALAQRWAATVPVGSIEAQLAELQSRLDLAEMAAEAGQEVPVRSAPPSVVLIPLADPLTTAGLQDRELGTIRRLAILGPRSGVSVVFLAADDLRNCFGDGVPGPLLPLVPVQIDDPWVGLTWDFTPDDGTAPDGVALAIDLRTNRGR